MLTAITAYLEAQRQAMIVAERPTGTLEPKQVRGYNPRYKYKFQEYPKALTPPPVVIESEEDERTFRVREGQPLPWDTREMIALYYSKRQYPARMQPTQVIVNSVHEENVRLAEWNVQSADRIAYPRWMFHASLPPKLVSSPDAEHALGNGWYGTVGEAVEAAQVALTERQEVARRPALLQRATELGIKHDPSWTNERLDAAIAKADEKAKNKAA